MLCRLTTFLALVSNRPEPLSELPVISCRYHTLTDGRRLDRSSEGTVAGGQLTLQGLPV